MRPRVLYLEPFHGGSHARFGETLVEGLPQFDWRVWTLPGRHWKWRMRGSAATFAEQVPHEPFDLIFASSYLPLAEFLGLRPDLAGTPSLLYFHENQLAFPARPGEDHPERDHHFGFTQIVSALAATRCVFNSAHNRDTFVDGARALLRQMPDQNPGPWAEAVADRSEVLALPLAFAPRRHAVTTTTPDPQGPLILWNHRWEHDKAPEVFFEALGALAERAPFRLAVCGTRFSREPRAFAQGRARLGERVVHWGGDDPREVYERWLGRADIAVSTARHEFFGISVFEAMHFGAHPVVPDALAYRETVPPKYRYAPGELVSRLETLCHAYLAGQPLRADRSHLTRPFSAEAMLPRYAACLRSLLR